MVRAPGPLDRVVSLDSAPEQVVRVATALASSTRVAALAALARSPTPLTINEVARRIGVDASPARGHLESLVKAGLADEVATITGRARPFTTRLTNARIVLEGANRAKRLARPAPAPKDVTKLERKLEAIEKQMAALADKAARVARDLEAAWERAARTSA